MNSLMDENFAQWFVFVWIVAARMSFCDDHRLTVWLQFNTLVDVTVSLVLFDRKRNNKIHEYEPETHMFVRVCDDRLCVCGC